MKCKEILRLLEKNKRYREKDIISIIQHKTDFGIINVHLRRKTLHSIISPTLYYLSKTNKLERFKIETLNGFRYEYELIGNQYI